MVSKKTGREDLEVILSLLALVRLSCAKRRLWQSYLRPWHAVEVTAVDSSMTPDEPVNSVNALIDGAFKFVDCIKYFSVSKDDTLVFVNDNPIVQMSL